MNHAFGIEGKKNLIDPSRVKIRVMVMCGACAGTGETLKHECCAQCGGKKEIERWWTLEELTRINQAWRVAEKKRLEEVAKMVQETERNRQVAAMSGE